MRAFISTKLGSNVEDALNYLQPTTKPIPKPTSRGLLIKVEVAALNFFDGLILQGKYQVPIKPPFIPASEFSGVVMKIGKKVTNFKVGDRVCGANQTGVMAEYIVVTPESVWKMPSNMSFEDGASFHVTYGTSYMALVQRANINKSTTMLVTAASGGCGTACLQIGKAIGCKRIIGCVGSEPKAKVAKECGADLCINYTKDPNWSKYLKKNKIGIDVFADFVGGESWNQGLKCMNWFGKAIVLGFTGGTIQKIKANRVLLKNIDVVGVAWGATSFHDFDIYRASVSDALKLYEKGLLKPKIGGVYNFDLNGIKQAFMDLMSRKSVGKLLIKIANNNQSKL